MTSRIVADGKTLSLDGQPWRARGVTYGSFVPRFDGERFPERAVVKTDLRAIAERGLNTIRTYELPPPDFLDIAEEFELQVLVGLHYHDWRRERDVSRSSRRRIRDAGLRAIDDALERCAERMNVLAVAVGNEVPNDLVRVHGISSVEDILSEFVASIHAGSDFLATYVNFPTTGFLEIAEQDLMCFNVFLEDPGALRRYLRHLHVVAGPRPLLVTELGLPSAVCGEAAQATSLASQLIVVDEEGCAGATVFAWTDDWGVGGEQVDGWGFGVTDVDRRPKDALDVLGTWAARELVDLRDHWPTVSVVVCAYNEETTLEECLTSLVKCSYPALEVIVCDDGSTDRTREVAQRFPFCLLELDHGGLSRARNAGIEVSTGEIIAYLDADASCHPEWLFHIVMSLEDANVAATGGPNLPVKGVGFAERAVALSPGSPREVLVSDDRAEHVPGCNMAFDKAELQAIGGFDELYTSAGDDVDVCWKLQDCGRDIAFANAAQVHHHRRATVKGYLRQQRGYGRAERMLATRHAHRFNRLGQARWTGIIYGDSRILPALLRPVVYHGHQGAAPFQRVARRKSETARMWCSALLPLALPVALIGTLLAILFGTWLLAVPLLAVLAVAAYTAVVGWSVAPGRLEPRPWAMKGTVAVLHAAQPFARAAGRLEYRRRRPALRESVWSGRRWEWLHELERGLRARRCLVRVGDVSDSWDLEAAVGWLWTARITTAVSWEWDPHVRTDVHPRPVVWISVGLAIVAALVIPPVGLVALGVLAVSSAAEICSVRVKVASVVRHTTNRTVAS